MEEKETKWWLHVKKCAEECKISMGEVKRLTKEDIKKKTREWDTCNWKSEMESKESLALYRSWKSEIKEEEVYDNTFSSILLFRARTNTLGLNKKNRHQGGNVNCPFCGVEEDANHFILHCPQ